MKKLLIACVCALGCNVTEELGQVPQPTCDDGSVCPSVLGWDPSEHAFDYMGKGLAYGVSLPETSYPRVCQTLLIGVRYDLECGIPNGLDVFFGDGVPSDSQLETHHFAMLDAQSTQVLESKKTMLYRFHQIQHYAAEERPFVGLVVAAGVCAAAVSASCEDDTERAYKLDPDGTWAPMSDVLGSEHQLVLGVGDCSWDPSQ